MPTSLRAGVGALVATVFTAASLVLAGPAVAQTPSDIVFLDVGPSITAGSIQLGASLSQICDSNVTEAQISITKNTVPVSGVTVAAGTSPYGFLMTVPASAANLDGQLNVLDVSVTCNVASSPVTQNGSFTWSQINVTKIVEGPSPSGTGFPILIACTPARPPAVSALSIDPAVAPFDFPFTLAAGETVSVISRYSATCSVTETDIMGATTSVVSQASVDLAAPQTYNVTVTNTFAETPKFTG